MLRSPAPHSGTPSPRGTVPPATRTQPHPQTSSSVTSHQPQLGASAWPLPFDSVGRGCGKEWWEKRGPQYGGPYSDPGTGQWGGIGKPQACVCMEGTTPLTPSRPDSTTKEAPDCIYSDLICIYYIIHPPPPAFWCL